MKRALLRAILGTTILLTGCATRERLNPLDPKNSQTHGGITGFNAIAADGVVELRWRTLEIQGVLGYRVYRWFPGGAPQPLGEGDYHPDASAGEDSTVVNGSTYVYRLVAHLASGDSAVSPPDTATPGTRRILTLEAGTPSLTGLSPDGRDVLFQRVLESSPIDMELDRKSQHLWVASDVSGTVLRRTLDGAVVGAVLTVSIPVDVSVSSNRGIGWVVSSGEQRVISFGPDLSDPNPQRAIVSVGHPRVAEAGTFDPTVWVGSEEGIVSRYRAQDLALTDEWALGTGLIRAIALDESTGGAWVATRSGSFGKLYYLEPGISVPAFVRDLQNPVDLAVRASTGDVWVSERGTPDAGNGRLSLVARSGAALATVGSIEPYGIDADPIDGSCWVADLRSNRVFHVDVSGAILRSSPTLQIPYAVRIGIP